MSVRLAWLAGVILVSLCGLLLYIIPARSHDAPGGWQYDLACCSNADCAPIESYRVRAVSSGYLIDGKHLVAFRDVKQSGDGLYHACFPTPDDLRCFYAPPSGV